MKLKTILATAMVAAILPAQRVAPLRTLEGIMAQYQAEMAKASADPKAYKAVVKNYEAALREYMKDEAKGGEKCQTRFALVSLLMYSGRLDDARSTLGDFQVGIANSVLCAQAAAMAQELQLPGKKALWIKAALGKRGSFEERMKLGTILMTALYEIKAAETLFKDALSNASDKPSKARVIWHIAKATREREDLPEGAYEKALRDLAENYPGTRHGKIAADRIKAMDFRVGGEPLPLRVETVGGGVFELAAQRKQGKAVLLCYLAAEIPSSVTAAKAFQALHDKYGERDLAVLGIWLDVKQPEALAAIKQLKLSFPQTTPAGGWDSDLALRLRLENAPQCMLIGRNGKIAGMNFLLITKSGQQQLTAAVSRAVGKN